MEVQLNLLKERSKLTEDSEGFFSLDLSWIDEFEDNPDSLANHPMFDQKMEEKENDRTN